MKATVTSLFLLLTLNLPINGQVADMVLNTQLSGIIDTVATASITMKPGFSYTASSGNYFTARVYPHGIPTANGAGPATVLPEGSTMGGPSGNIGELVGNDGVVGAIPGQLSVNQIGAATYTVPIDVPAGINGMQPNLALSYNSMAGNGIVGWGWNIAGLSVITRTGKTIYFDGKVEGVGYTASDNFVLDGQRLIIKAMYPHSSTVSTADSILYLVNDNLTTKVMGYACDEYGPTSFKVWSGKGTIMTYEKVGIDSRRYTATNLYTIEWNVGDTIFLGRKNQQNSYSNKYSDWYVTSAEDVYGNEMTFEYLNTFDRISTNYGPNTYYDENGNIVPYENLQTGVTYEIEVDVLFFYDGLDLRINGIEYAGGNLSVAFGYDDNRNDVVSGYTSGRYFRQKYRLNNISVKQGSNVVRRYDLTYRTNSHDYSKLVSIKLTGRNDEAFNKTVFNWQPSTYDFYGSYDYVLSLPDLHATRINSGYTLSKRTNYPADFNGDGISDFLTTYLYSKNGSPDVLDWAAYINPGTVGNLNDCGYGNIPSGMFYLIDRNIDGKTELYIQSGYSEGSYQFVKFMAREMNNGLLARKTDIDFRMQLLGGATYSEVTLAHGDFDGDGLPEYLVLNDDLSITTAWIQSPYTAGLSGEEYFLTDINGNGKIELVFKIRQGHFWETVPYNQHSTLI